MISFKLLVKFSLFLSFLSLKALSSLEFLLSRVRMLQETVAKFPLSGNLPYFFDKHLIMLYHTFVLTLSVIFSAFLKILFP